MTIKEELVFKVSLTQEEMEAITRSLPDGMTARELIRNAILSLSEKSKPEAASF